MTSGIIDDTTPVDCALTSTRESLAELITVLRDGGLDHYDPGGKLQVLDRVQELMSMMQAVDAEVLAGCRDSGVLEAECQRSMAKVLERRCLVGPGEAKRRTRAADAVGPRISVTGLPLPRLRPRICEAVTAGEVNADQVRVVCDTLDKLDRADVDPHQVETIEAELVDHCRQFGPKELQRLGQRYLDAYDPDGQEPDEERNHDRRSFVMRPTPSGAYVGQFRLTGELGAKIAAVLSPLAKPRVSGTEGNVPAAEMADLRSYEQRMHDALDDAISRLLRAGDLPDSGGTPASVIITIDAEDLRTHTDPLRPTPAPTPQGWVCPHCGATTQPETATENPTPPEDLAGDEGLPDQAARPNGAQDPATRDNTANDQHTQTNDTRDRTAHNDGGPDQNSQDSGTQDQITATINESAATDPTTRKDRTGCVLDTDTARIRRADDLEHRPTPPKALGPPGRVRRRRPRHGTTSDGATLTIPELLRLAGEADIYPVVMTQHGQLLDLGYTRRIANKQQTIALIARDGGCSFPGCDHPPEWCQRHHIISWLENGKTSVDNLTLVCTFHHHQFLLRGWSVKINNDGLPEWTPPRWVDPDQKPMINNRIIARIHQTTLIDEWNQDHVVRRGWDRSRT